MARQIVRDPAAYFSRADEAAMQTPSTAISICGWFNRNTYYENGDYSGLAKKRTGGVSYMLGYAGGAANRFMFRIYDGTTEHEAVAAFASSADTWYFVHGYWSSGNALTVKVYDATGSLQRTDASGAVTGSISYASPGVLQLKNENTNDSRSAQMGIWSVVLSEAQALAFKDGTNYTTGQVGYWKLNESGATDNAADSGVNGLTLTQSGSPAAYTHPTQISYPAAGPAITDVNTDEALSPSESITITGTNFGASQGAGGVAITQEAGAVSSAVTVTGWSATSITGTVALGGLSYGATTSLVVTDNAAATGSIAVTFVPATGYSYVTLAGYPHASGIVVGDGASPALVDGDQVEYESVASSGAGVTVNADGSFVLDTTDPGHFQYRVRDDTDNTWSEWETIYVNEAAPSELVGAAPTRWWLQTPKRKRKYAGRLM